MSNASHYEINVSQHGRHLFATAERSLQCCLPEKAQQLAQVIRDRFPADEGFEVRLTYWNCSGTHVDIDGDQS